jgi:hypothetical protein
VIASWNSTAKRIEDHIKMKCLLICKYVLN